MIFKCKDENCEWEGEKPSVQLLHDENMEHEEIYLCPQCNKQIILTDLEETVLEKEIHNAKLVESLSDTIDNLKMALVTISLTDNVKQANNTALLALRDFND